MFLHVSMVTANTKDRPVLSSLVRFGLVGGIATIIHAGVSLACINFLRLPAEIGNVSGFLLAFLFASTLHATFTFPATKNKGRSVLRYFLVAACAMTLSQAIVYAAGFLSADPSASAILGAIAAAGVSFVVSRAWAFQ